MTHVFLRVLFASPQFLLAVAGPALVWGCAACREWARRYGS